MTLPASGPISFSQIQAEFGGSNPISFSEYYRNGGYVTSNNTGIPTSGAISMSQFYGGEALISSVFVETASQSQWSAWNWSQGAHSITESATQLTVDMYANDGSKNYSPGFAGATTAELPITPNHTYTIKYGGNVAFTSSGTPTYERAYVQIRDAAFNLLHSWDMVDSNSVVANRHTFSTTESSIRFIVYTEAAVEYGTGTPSVRAYMSYAEIFG